MALCISVNPTVESVVHAFALNDTLLKTMAVREHDQRKREGDPDVGDTVDPINCGDDYFTAPYALVPCTRRKSKSNPNPQIEYKMVFTAYKVRTPHYDVVAMFPKELSKQVWLSGSTGDIEEGAFGPKVKRENWIQFREYAYAGGNDVCQKLYEYAFEAACKAMNIPDADIEAANADSTWQTQRMEETTRLSNMARSLPYRERIAAVPMPDLPTWGSIPFAPLSAEVRAEAEAEAAKEREREVEEEKKRKREDAEAHLQAKKARYEPVIAAAITKYPEGTPHGLSDADTCVSVFDSGPNGEEGPFHCPYDRKNDGIFCSMCLVMKDKLGA